MFFLKYLGMMVHRGMTLGHIVATTKLPWKKLFGLKKKKEFDAEKLLAKKGIEMMKEWQASYQVSFLNMYHYVRSSMIRPSFYVIPKSIIFYRSCFSRKEGKLLPWKVQ